METLVTSPTADFKYLRFPFDRFNPVQSEVLPLIEGTDNILVAVPTGAGKTACAEMAIAYSNAQGQKGIYISPFKAIAQERWDQWRDLRHGFSDRRISICTGDYKLTEVRQEEIRNSHVLSMTYEMLAHRARMYQSEKSEWISQTGTLVIDEIHSLGEDGRGDRLEGGLIDFFLVNRECRIIGLSATLINAEEIAEWMTQLNGRPTRVVKSDWRPVPLEVHFIPYRSFRRYQDDEDSKLEAAVHIVQDLTEKCLVFVHTKTMGRRLVEALTKVGVQSFFHNRDASKQDRTQIEESFRSGDLRVIVSTSTLSAGVNLPARNVIIVGMSRGMNDVSSVEIQQEMGRAGRPGLDDKGDAWVLVPDNAVSQHRDRITRGARIESGLAKALNLAFHLVGEVCLDRIKYIDDAVKWHGMSLAHVQGKKASEEDLLEIMDQLIRISAIGVNSDGQFGIRPIGEISTRLYYDPFTVADAKRNWSKVFERGLSGNDVALAWALGNVSQFYERTPGKNEQVLVDPFKYEVEKLLLPYKSVGCLFQSAGFYLCLTGNQHPLLAGITREAMGDAERYCTMIQQINRELGHWTDESFFELLQLRILYGLPGDVVHLCRIPGVGGALAMKLWEAGLKTVQDVASNLPLVQVALGQNRGFSIVMASRGMCPELGLPIVQPEETSKPESPKFEAPKVPQFTPPQGTPPSGPWWQ